MKEIIGKKKCNTETLPKHLIDDEMKINDAKSIAESFTIFLSTLGQILQTKFLNVTYFLNHIFLQ